MFLNSKLKQIAGGACCLTRYEIIVGNLYICKAIICKFKFIFEKPEGQ